MNNEQSPYLTYSIRTDKSGIEKAMLALLNLPSSVQEQAEWYHQLPNGQSCLLTTGIGSKVLAVICAKKKEQPLPSLEEMITAVEAYYKHQYSWAQDIRNWPINDSPSVVEARGRQLPPNFSGDTLATIAARQQRTRQVVRAPSSRRY